MINGNYRLIKSYPKVFQTSKQDSYAIFGIVVAICLNWRNSYLGYWLNLVVVSAADLVYIFFILVPGYVPLVSGGLGPLLWVLALIFSTLAIVKDRQ